MAMKRIDAFFLLLFVVRGIALGDREGVKRPFTDGDVWSPSLKKTKCSTKPLEVTFDQPAKHWTDAIPIGNGRLGAMVWGGVANETINLNEDTLWTGNPGDYGDPGVPPILSEVRKLVDDGQYAAATTAALNMSGGSSAVYQLLGDIRLEFDDSHATYDKGTYKKVLDLDTATVKVEYSANGVGYVRKYFASNPDQVIAIKISGDKPAHVNFTAYLDSKMQHNSFVNDKNQIIMDGSCPGNPRGIQYSAVLDLQSNDGAGVVRVLDGQKLRAEGCNSAVILFVASSSFDGPFTNPANSKRDPKSSSLIAMDSVKRFSYADLYARHVDDYHELFHRVKLGLWKSSENVHANHSSSGEDTDKAISTAERVRNFKTDEDPSLVEILFQYGRYLLIACSRPGTQVANLQGIWNKDITPPWNGAQHLNINLQMNYWPSLPCNLHECQEPLFDFISSLSINGKKTAAVNYNASGWVAHQVSDIWAKTSPDSGQAVWALWQMGGAWLSTHLWEHYTYTLDKDFLRNKAYPLLKSSASFLLDWLIEGSGGFLETNPSTSPEHNFIAPDGKPASVSYSTTMDMAIINEVFSSIVSAAEVLGKNNDSLIARVRVAQLRLPPTKIARDGSIMEWAQDLEDPEVQHRHLSHLFGLFPGRTITLEKTPELYKAADSTLHKRGEQGPGWSTMWKAALWARLRNSTNAYQMIKHLFDLVDPDHESNFEGGLYSNLFTAHPPFQIDANFGFSAAVAEMLIQSTVQDMYLLPALPRDKWPNGCVKGLKARGGITVKVRWSEGELEEFGLWSTNQDTVKNLHYRGITATVEVSSATVYTFDKQLKLVKTEALY